MAEVSSFIKFITDSFLQSYESVVNSLPPNLQMLPSLFLFTILIALYAIFIWAFYRFLAQRDLIKLNLNKYNQFEHAFWVKFLAVVLYIIEFIIVLPFIVIFWFTVFSLILIILVKEQAVANLLLISASLIAAIRISSYYKEDLARDLAKIAPFTLLAVALFSPDFFVFSTTLARFSEIPLLFNNLIAFALFILIIEAVLRVFYLLVSFKKSEEVRE